ncbi:Kelch repeat-containing protein [Chryseolinea lacunae]|uniref:Galactose oxidase n=1 Tax=Chryseolinea lacunae TaxID=2801331 RepID=A0ABS1L1B1_9BACT|nr:kelch repeat-containing protein [Chryseolinea lacunae]MBL0745501.1 hypothetical protein [Chryseolinea lacunae]
MKKITTLVFACMLWACSDPVQLTSTTTNGLSKTEGAATLGLGLGQYEWKEVQLPDPAHYPINDPTANKGFLFANGNAYWFIGSVWEYQYRLNKAAPTEWKLLPNEENLWNAFHGGYQYLFSKGSRFYVGFHDYEEIAPNEERAIYWYDVKTRESGRLADFPGTITEGHNVFAAGEKAYVIGGQRGLLVSNQYWEYDFATNQWTNKGGLPGGARAYGVAHVIDGKVYYGLGYNASILNGQLVKQYKNDWYLLTPGATIAATRADFPGTKRTNGEGFVINSKVYIGWGKSAGGTNLNDFWEFNPANNTWTSKPNCPSAQSGPRNMRAFAIGETGYFIRGCFGSFWTYSNSTTLAVAQ